LAGLTIALIVLSFFYLAFGEVALLLAQRRAYSRGFAAFMMEIIGVCAPRTAAAIFTYTARFSSATNRALLAAQGRKGRSGVSISISMENCLIRL
jgi:hypothetical protein